MSVQDIRNDLLDEQASLDAIVAGLTDEQWGTDTPSPGWTVADQIGHLGYFDRTAALAITDPDGFAAHMAELVAMFADDEAVEAETLGGARTMTPTDLLTWWRTGRTDLDVAARSLDDDDRVPWYGPSMGAKSFLTARLMECWAHGQDVCDAVGVTRAPTDRLRHICRIGFITRGWSYANRNREAPDIDVSVRLTPPSGGDPWMFGPDDAPETIAGPAEDFCLVVTQRRHVDDTDLDISGDAAREWMMIAQAFAGGATDGPAPKG